MAKASRVTVHMQDVVRDAVVAEVRKAAEAAGQNPDLASIQRAVEADMSGRSEPWGREH